MFTTAPRERSPATVGRFTSSTVFDWQSCSPQRISTHLVGN